MRRVDPIHKTTASENRGSLKRSMTVLKEYSSSDLTRSTEHISSAQPAAELEKETELDPTRYGDWVRNGRCIDF